MPGRSIRTSRGATRSPILPVLTAVIVIAALYFFKELLIPFALALLFGFLLAPPVTWLEKLRSGRMPSVLIVMLVAFSIAGGLAWMGTQELTQIVEELPHYQANIRTKLHVFGNPHRGGVMKAASTIEHLKGEIAGNSGSVNSQQKAVRQLNAQRRAAGEPEEAPVPVEIVPRHHTGVLGSLGIVGPSLARVAAEAAAVVVLTLFMLLNRTEIMSALGLPAPARFCCRWRSSTIGSGR